MVGLLLAALIGLSARPADAQQEVVEYYHLDAVGSVRAVTDGHGQVVRRHDYFPFGEEYLATGSLDRLRFTGKARDLETGLDYFGARYYASTLGRFTTVDPVLDIEQALVDPQRWNRYAYVRNNPLRYTDPDGRAIETLWDVISLATSAKAVWQDPTSVSNWVSLGADIVSVVAPGVPAIGIAVRGGGKIGDAVDATRLFVEGSEIAGGARSVVASARLKRQLASEEIAGGHAFLKHVVERGEFPGIRTRRQFAELIETVMEKPTHTRELSAGRTAYWRDGVVVIRNRRAGDGGTAFVPRHGLRYFLEELK
jgi:RHS repeat-associated protein